MHHSLGWIHILEVMVKWAYPALDIFIYIQININVVVVNQIRCQPDKLYNALKESSQ